MFFLFNITPHYAIIILDMHFYKLGASIVPIFSTTWSQGKDKGSKQREIKERFSHEENSVDESRPRLMFLVGQGYGSRSSTFW